MIPTVFGPIRGLDLLDVDVERVQLDIAEHGRGAHVLDDIGGGDPGEGRHDHLVPRLKTEYGNGEVERGRARRGRRRIRDLDVGGKSLLEARDERSLHDPAAVQRLLDRLELLWAEQGLGDRDLQRPRGAGGDAGADVGASHSTPPRRRCRPAATRRPTRARRAGRPRRGTRAAPRRARCCRSGW